MIPALQQETSNQEQLGTLLSFRNEKSFYRKTYMNWDHIERANKKENPILRKSTYLSHSAKAILSIIVGKLKKGNRVFLNHKYISTITLSKRNNNRRIIGELDHVLDITYRNTITVDGKKHRYSYEFAFKIEKPERITSIENSIDSFSNSTNEIHYIEEENKYIEDIDLGSNISEISSFKIQDQTSSSQKTDSFKTSVSKKIVSKRKKATNADKKARVYKPKFDNQYDEPKSLAEHYPLTSLDCSNLQTRSGRDFDLNAMNEILLDLSKKPKPSKHRFPSEKTFTAYLSKIFRYEKRDAVEINKLNFKITARMTDCEIADHTTLAEREKFLNNIETQAIMSVSPDNQVRAKLASSLLPSVAYNLLSRLKCFQVDDNILKMYLTSEIALSALTQETILQEANAVGGSYSGVTKLEIIND